MLCFLTGRKRGRNGEEPVIIKTLKGAVQGATLEGGIRRMIYPTSFSQTNEGKAIYEAALKLFNNGAGGEDKSSTRLWWDCKR